MMLVKVKDAGAEGDPYTTGVMECRAVGKAPTLSNLVHL